MEHEEKGVLHQGQECEADSTRIAFVTRQVEAANDAANHAEEPKIVPQDGLKCLDLHVRQDVVKPKARDA